MAESTAASARSAVWQRLLVGALWLGVAVVIAALIAQRYVDATVGAGIDLDAFYLPAARRVAEGGSPYDIEGYVYTPLIAMILAPVAGAAWVIYAWKGLLIVVAVVACVLGVLASTPGDSGVRRPLVLGVAVVSVLYSRPMSVDLWLGNANAFVLLAVAGAMFAHSRGRARWAGLAVGFAALVKTWPGGMLLWLVRAPLRLRVREWQGVGLAALIGLVMTLAVGGPTALQVLAEATFRYSDQELVAYSAWGAGDYLFTDQAHALPIVVSPLLARIISWTLALVLLGLLVLLLRRPGHSVLAIPNLMFVLVLLIPVAHGVYMVLALPALWWWTARALEGPRRIDYWLPVVVLTVWWVVTMRIARTTVEGAAAQAQFVLIMAVSLAAVTTSIICASLIGRTRKPKRKGGHIVDLATSTRIHQFGPYREEDRPGSA